MFHWDKNMMGIYKIYCCSTNMCYIGQSINVKQRLLTHLSLLRNGRSHNYLLQNDFDKYGEDNFVFSVVCNVNKYEDLDAYEYFYITKYNSYNNGYNLSKGNYKNLFRTKVFCQPGDRVKLQEVYKLYCLLCPKKHSCDNDLNKFLKEITLRKKLFWTHFYVGSEGKNEVLLDNVIKIFNICDIYVDMLYVTFDVYIGLKQLYGIEEGY